MTSFITAIARAASCAALLTGCVDTTPLLDSQGADAGRADGGVLVAEASVRGACRACIVGDGGACQSKFDECAKDERCRRLMNCGLDIGCFTVPTLQERITCFGPCLNEVQIMAATDPSLQLGLALNACAQDLCLSACTGQ